MTPATSDTRVKSATLLALFLVSAAAVGFEIALTRYFAVAKWSEYGYWVISIVMVGFAVSGVVLAIFRDALVRWGEILRVSLPSLMVLAAALGFHFTITNPFNPLELQNQVTWASQLQNIALYYASLFPFYFLTGLYISLTFVMNARQIGKVYGFDLAGAGIGAAATLGLMFVVHSFRLIPVLLVPLAISALLSPGKHRVWGIVAAIAALGAGEAVLILGPQPAFNDFKAIYAPLHTPDAKVVAERYSPVGDYMLLKDFTERLDTDVSNDAAMLGYPGPPTAFGLYRDGNRIAALPRAGVFDAAYAPGTLAAAPYALLDKPKVLLIGTSGGYRIAEALTLGAPKVDALETEPTLYQALTDGFGPAAAIKADSRVSLYPGGAMARVAAGPAGRYDLIDISGDYLDTSETNGTAFGVEAVAADLRAVKPTGIVSIPVSIRDLPVYALRLLATVRQGLLRAGVKDPASHVLVYRSAWNVRILVSPTAWDSDRIAALKAFCDARSFDISYYPGIDPVKMRAGIYNDLPSVSFTTGQVVSDGPDDAIANEAAAVLAGRASPSGDAFDLTPLTLDRPQVYATLRLSQLDVILKRLEILPQAEIGGLVNVAVLAQAVVIALLVLAIPLVAGSRLRRKAPDAPGFAGPSVYFAALGLGFLFIEIFLIEKASFYLNDRTSGFAIILTGMLVFSGLGSLIAGAFAKNVRVALTIAAILVLAWLAAVWFKLEPFLLGTLDAPEATKIAYLLAIAAPVSLALGMPFSLGLSRVGSGGILPWAWGLNGAFSVVATPLANLIARDAGYSYLLIGAAVLYSLVILTFPSGAWNRPQPKESV
jgi:hypothetical protein